jgi:hypothetical protein
VYLLLALANSTATATTTVTTTVFVTQSTDVWTIIAAAFTMIAALLFIPSAAQIINDSFLKKPKLELARSLKVNLSEFEIHDKGGKVVTKNAAIYYCGVANSSSTHAHRAIPLFFVKSFKAGVPTGWQAMPFNSLNKLKIDSEMPDTADDFAQLITSHGLVTQQKDFGHAEVSNAILFIAVEDGKCLHLLDKGHNTLNIPYDSKVVLRVVGDFKMTKPLWSGHVSVNSWYEAKATTEE